ncbi:PAQR family membrane homeostasis protein TrhA [Clostridium ihumii]|uniref:PAQR family membrane homeostasis protein TrhA n=1 Tax=Clostridium ihumii TaxID=1470356 RepID=UPI0005574BFC|nr:hemolysin III family protein [Clostridium ihumii]
MNKYFREPVSGFTHLFGAVFSLIGLVSLIHREFINRTGISSLVGVIIFGLSLIFLYTASTIYHLVVSSDKVIKVLKKLDHSMIFILIAGTYTPICLIGLQSYLKWGLLIFIWTLSIIGIILKVKWIDCPKWVSSVLYVSLGWIAVFILSPLSKTVAPEVIYLLVLGGVLYTIGAVIYCIEKKGSKRTFGAHEIFHIFVMLGSLAHYMCIFKYLI